MSKQGGRRERPQEYQDEFRIDIYEESGNSNYWVDWSRTPFDIEEAEERWLKRWKEGFPEGTVFEHEDEPDNTERSWSRYFMAINGGEILERIEVCQVDDAPKEGEEPTYSLVKFGGYFETARRLAFPDEYEEDEPMPERWHEVLAVRQTLRFCRWLKSSLYMSEPITDEDIAMTPDYDFRPHSYTERPEPLNMDDYLQELVEWYIEERKKGRSDETAQVDEEAFPIIPEGIYEELPF